MVFESEIRIGTDRSHLATNLDLDLWMDGGWTNGRLTTWPNLSEPDPMTEREGEGQGARMGYI